MVYKEGLTKSWGIRRSINSVDGGIFPCIFYCNHRIRDDFEIVFIFAAKGTGSVFLLFLFLSSPSFISLPVLSFTSFS